MSGVMSAKKNNLSQEQKKIKLHQSLYQKDCPRSLDPFYIKSKKTKINFKLGQDYINYSAGYPARPDIRPDTGYPAKKLPDIGPIQYPVQP